MSKLEKLEDEVRHLSTEELAAFRDWFSEYDAKAWDREIDLDASAEKLDALADRALEAHLAGKTTPPISPLRSSGKATMRCTLRFGGSRTGISSC